MSRRTCAAERPLRVAIALQRLRRQPSLAERLLRNGRRPLLYGSQREQTKNEREEDETAGDDQQSQPDGRDRRDSRGSRCDAEPEGEEQEHGGAEAEADPKGER